MIRSMVEPDEGSSSSGQVNKWVTMLSTQALSAAQQ